MPSGIPSPASWTPAAPECAPAPPPAPSPRTPARAGGARPIPPDAGTRWRVELDEGQPLRTRHLVLALAPGGLRTLLAGSPGLAAAAPELAGQVAALALAPPFAVTRLWLDRDVDPERPT